jgi:hypothetical protein
MGGKVFKGVGKVVKSVAAPALAIGGGLLGGPSGAALGGSLGGLFGGGAGSGIGQIGGGVYDYYNNRTIDKGILEAQLKAGEEASQLLNPYYQTGTAANQRLSDRLMNGFQFNQADLYNDPGYQFQFEQGQRGLNAQAASSGLLGSGRALKEATQYGQGMAEGQFNNVYNRNLNRFNVENTGLSGLANRGQAAASSIGNLKLGMGENRAKYRSSRGAGRAGLVGNITQGLSPLLSNLGDYMQKEDVPATGGFGSYFANNVPVSRTPSFIQNQFLSNRPGGRGFQPMGRVNFGVGSGGSNWKVLY